MRRAVYFLSTQGDVCTKIPPKKRLKCQFTDMLNIFSAHHLEDLPCLYMQLLFVQCGYEMSKDVDCK